MSTDEMGTYYSALVDRHPIWSIEDGLAENGWHGWKHQPKRSGTGSSWSATTSSSPIPRIDKATQHGIANTARHRDAHLPLQVCRENGYAAMISHRSGETPDHLHRRPHRRIRLRTRQGGAPARGARVGKYNRLLQTATQTPDLHYWLPPPTPSS